MSKRNDDVHFDADNPEWTLEDFARARAPQDVLPQEILSQFPNTRQRGPQKAPKKVPTSIRLSPEVIEHFKQQGRGWQSRIDSILREVAEREKRLAGSCPAGWCRKRLP